MSNYFSESLEKYKTIKRINYTEYFTKNDFDSLKKLGITIDPSRLYTEEEHELFEMDLVEYWDGAERVDGTLEPPMKDLTETGITREEYNCLLEKMNKVETCFT